MMLPNNAGFMMLLIFPGSLQHEQGKARAALCVSNNSTLVTEINFYCDITSLSKEVIKP